ncbi:MAG: hypothetical protein HOO96_12775 [Polyangiaceae bacterium]|nr:hypothetical protein [Polyangiaceae bacterium]
MKLSALAFLVVASFVGTGCAVSTDPAGDSTDPSVDDAPSLAPKPVDTGVSPKMNFACMRAICMEDAQGHEIVSEETCICTKWWAY